MEEESTHVVVGRHEATERLGLAVNGEGKKADGRSNSSGLTFLFLDIEMPGLKGFEVLRSIPSAIEIRSPRQGRALLSIGA